ncbi:MAG: hypothetical protein M1819_007141 [Sarea resinae]|nr:MAG: hypothetical protein M1819_007141 [Sarea resinae]
MASNPAMELASTLQSASLNRSPSPAHDMNPSTAASRKEPVTLSSPSYAPHDRQGHAVSEEEEEEEIEGIELDEDDEEEELEEEMGVDDIPVSVLEARPRRPGLPPLPDLRFEQSYLKSIEAANGWGAVGYITMRDQVFLPLVQGMLWNLVLAGWHHWNRSAQFSGQTVGSRIRRWWWGVNNWEIPPPKSAAASAATKLRDRKFAGKIGEYYKTQFGNASTD